MPVLAFIRKVDVTFCSGLVSNVQIDIILFPLSSLWKATNSCVQEKNHSIEGLFDTEERE